MRLNTTALRYSADQFRGFQQAIAWALIPLLVVGVISNALVLSSIVFIRKLRSLSSAFLANLAICDLLICAVILPSVAHALLRGTAVYRVR